MENSTSRDATPWVTAFATSSPKESFKGNFDNWTTSYNIIDGTRLNLSFISEDFNILVYVFICIFCNDMLLYVNRKCFIWFLVNKTVMELN